MRVLLNGEGGWGGGRYVEWPRGALTVALNACRLMLLGLLVNGFYSHAYGALCHAREGHGESEIGMTLYSVGF